MDSMYVLTDARGFTTCTADTHKALYAEAARVPLLVPVEVRRWQRNTLAWVLRETFNWDGLYCGG